MKKLRRKLNWKNIRYTYRCKVTYPRQRAKRGWSDKDTWSFDAHLSRVISGGVQHLRDNLHSYPCDLTIEEWEFILDDLVAAFKIAEEPWDMYSDSNFKYFFKVFDLFKEYYFNLWD